MAELLFRSKKTFLKEKAKFLKKKHHNDVELLSKLLLSSLLHEDLNLAHKLRSVLEQFSPLPNFAREVLSQFYLRYRDYFAVTRHLWPVFDQGVLKSEFKKILQIALEETGLLRESEQVIASALRVGDDLRFWQIRGVVFQSRYREVLKLDKQRLKDNIRAMLNQDLTPNEKISLSHAPFHLMDHELGEKLIVSGTEQLENLVIREDSVKGIFNPDGTYTFLKKLVKLLEEKGLEPFLAFGTLLGMERDGKIFDHDKDSDIGVMDVPQEQLEQILKEICINSNVIAPHMVTQSKEQRADYIPVYDLVTNSVVDIFTFRTQEDEINASLQSTYGEIRWSYSKFELIKKTFGSDDFYIPQNVELFLEETYGDTWRTPVVLYDGLMESPNILNSSDPTTKVFALSRGSHHLKTGEFKKARYYFEHAKKRGAKVEGVIEKVRYFERKHNQNIA